MSWFRGGRGLTLPGQNYAGPFNSTSKEYFETHAPVNHLDYAAKQHDIRYAKMGPSSYFVYNKADAHFLRDIKGDKGFNARLARGFFTLKRDINQALGIGYHEPPNKRSKLRRSGQKIKSEPGPDAGDNGTMDALEFALGRSLGPGHGGNRFRRLRAKPQTDSYTMYGVKMMEDIMGTRKASDRALGIGIRSVVPRQLAVAAGMALFRDICRKHYKLEVTHPDQEIFSHMFNFRPDDATGNPALGTADDWNIAPMVPVLTGNDANQGLFSETGVDLRYGATDSTNTVYHNNKSTPEVYCIAFYTEERGEVTAEPAAQKWTFDRQEQKVLIPGKADANTYCVFRITGTTTLHNFGVWWAHKVLMGMFGNRRNPHVRLKGYQFFHVDYWKTDANFSASNIKGFLRPQGFQSLERSYIKVTSKAKLKIQNITPGDGNTTTTDAIDANPLSVVLYHHKTTMPIQRDPRQMGTISNNASLYTFWDNPKILADSNTVANDDGIIYARPPETTTGNEVADVTVGGFNGSKGPFNHIPPPEAFYAVGRCISDTLQPAEIKYHTVSFVFDGLIADFPHGFDEYSLGNNNTYPNSMLSFGTSVLNLKDLFGTCDMLWFTPVMSLLSGATDTTSRIKIAWEGFRSTWAKMKKQKLLPIMPWQNTNPADKAGVTDT